MGIHEQWAAEKASDWTVKPSTVKLEPIGKSQPVGKTFADVLNGPNELSIDEEIDRVVRTWTDADGIYAEDVEKGNPWHDPKNGRFTTGPKGGNPMIRTEPPPKNTKIAYKVFVVKDGKLYPPMVANPDGQETPVGVWLNASEGVKATDKDGNPITNTLGRSKVKAGGKGTQGGSGTLAYRPGWHLGELPIAEQFYTKDKTTGEKKQKKNFVWAECEIAADVDYQEKAMSYGYNKNGKFQHSLAGLPEIPKDGFYSYRTNPDPNTKPWYITGAMKVNRILTDAETNSILRSHGIEPMKRDGGELDLAALGITETNFVGKSENVAKTFAEILKFNPYHDSRGRFSTADGAASFTYAPGKSRVHDKAIAREKDKTRRSDFRDKIKKMAELANTQDPKALIEVGKEVAKEIDSRFKEKKRAGETEEDQLQTEDIYDVLRDVRDFGPGEHSDKIVIGSELDETRTKAIVDEALSRFPTDWYAEAAVDCGTMINDYSGRARHFVGYDGRSEIQVYAREDPNIVRDLGLGNDVIPNHGVANMMAHELGHYFERSNIWVGDAARTFYDKRTKNSEVTEMRPGEYTKKDRFADEYMGRVYTTGDTEITSVLVQKLGHANPKEAITTDFFGTQKKDIQSYNFVLGLLAVGGTP